MKRRDFLAGAFGSVIASQSELSGAERRWIDVHMHLIGGPQRQFREAVESALRHMDELGVTKAVVFPPPLTRPVFDYPAYLPEIEKVKDRFGFLGGGGLLNPLLQQHANPESLTSDVQQRLTEIARATLDAGAIGFGEIALLHLSLTRNHAFEQTSPEHPLMLALADIAGQRKAVIDLHMDAIATDDAPTPVGLSTPPNPPRLKSNIGSFERLLAHDRNARIVWAHGGSDFTGHMTPGLIRRLMDVHPNLYMSLRPLPPAVSFIAPLGLNVRNRIFTESGIVPEWNDLLKRHSGRFVLGADAFFLGSSVGPDNAAMILSRGNQARLQAAALLLARLPSAVAKKIATENAVQLYRL